MVGGKRSFYRNWTRFGNCIEMKDKGGNVIACFMIILTTSDDNGAERGPGVF